MFVRFSCGCIGLDLPAFTPDHVERGCNAVVLRACDLPTEMCDEPVTVWRRDLSDKSVTPLDPEQVEALLQEIGKLVGLGYRFRKMRRLLGIRED
jgi:hypothetical protein